MKKLTVVLAGNPNSGKSTFFNALTGRKQRVGNWPGVTIERKTGTLQCDSVEVTIIDLPGIYSLSVVSENTSVDAWIACEAILSEQIDLIVNIIDVTNLERSLFLTSQLLEMGLPVIVVVSMLDIAKKQGIAIDLLALSQKLGCQVIALNPYRKGIQQIKMAFQQASHLYSSLMDSNKIIYPPALQAEIKKLAQKLIERIPHDAANAYWLALRILEGDMSIYKRIDDETQLELNHEKTKIEALLKEETDVLIADARYGYANDIKQATTKKIPTSKHRVTQCLDRIVLNRILGVPIFLTVMYLLFLFAINLGGAFQDFFDITSDTIFVQGMAYLLHTMDAPSWIVAILAGGLGKGINTTVTFIPVIGGMFLFLSLLEDSGYMMRASFVMDRFMRALGLPGKSFVSLLIGFGCNVPAIMSARTLEYQRDRILTVMMAPFMSCGARLAIFAVFTAAFFPMGSQNIVFGLYLIGIFAAIVTGWFLRKTILKGDPAPLIMELPNYHFPQFKHVLMNTWMRLKGFLWRAGRLIVPFCMIIGILNEIPMAMAAKDGVETESLLAWIGHLFTFIFAPMGLNEANWPATVGLLAGILAKEVVVATLNTLYSQIGHLTAVVQGQFDFWGNMQTAVASIANNVVSLPDAFFNPIAATATSFEVTQGVFGIMYQHFAGKIGAFAYLLFVLLYVPCVSTIATIARELGAKWAWLSLVWNTSLAYAVAVLFYQAATLSEHVVRSCAWIIGIILAFILLYWGLRIFAHKDSSSRSHPFIREKKYGFDPT